jgi:CHAT domain-containing protein/tetratricopeptide (TPR) repeat protein
MPHILRNILFLCLFLSPLDVKCQITAADSSLMDGFMLVLKTTVHTDRVRCMRVCDSMEYLATKLDWQEQYLLSIKMRYVSASSFDDEKDMVFCMDRLDSELERLKNKLSADTYEAFQEDNWYNRAVLYYFKRDLGNALVLFQKLADRIEKKPQRSKTSNQRLFGLYQYMAGIYATTGAFEKAILYYQKSIDSQYGFNTSSITYVNALYKIGDICRLQQNDDKALGYYLQALDSLNAAVKQGGKDSWSSYGNYLHRRLGVYYADHNDFTKSLEHLQQAYTYTKVGTTIVALLEDDWGAIHGKMGQTEVALQHFNIALELKQKKYGQLSAQVAATYYLIAEIYQLQHDLPNMLHCNHLALEALCKIDLDEMTYENPIELPRGRELHLLKYLTQKLAALSQYQAQNTDQANLLNATWATAHLATKVIEQMRETFSISSDKQTLVQNYRTVYESAIRCAVRIGENNGQTTFSKKSADNNVLAKEQAFAFAEKTKSLILYESTQESNALQFGDIPATLLQSEHQLRIEITHQDKIRVELENKGIKKMEEEMVLVSKKIFDLEQEHEALKQNIAANYPNYYRLKYDIHVEDIASVQRDLLQPEQALVEYFVGDSAVYIFLILKTESKIVEIKKDFPLDTWVAQLRSGMTGYFTNPNLANQYEQLSSRYVDAAYNLYQKLIEPIAAQLPQEIVIITDGILGYVPFEVLLAEKPTNPTRWNTHHYLQKDYTISYCYSATMLREMRQRKHFVQPSIPFLGIAPQYDGDTTLLASAFPVEMDMRKDLEPLPYSGEEVYRVSQIMGGQSIVGPAATDVQFKTLASQTKILHLATHGQANDRLGDYCFLVFAAEQPAQNNNSEAVQMDRTTTEPKHQNTLLYARDIYNLSLHADLVTISACETGIGELQRGEGIISLARAFAYAGAKSVVTSLWSVSDAKTKDLMIAFYKNLHNGMTKDKALREAKLYYLNNNKGAAAHPFFWAGFVGIGDMEAIR